MAATASARRPPANVRRRGSGWRTCAHPDGLAAERRPPRWAFPATPAAFASRKRRAPRDQHGQQGEGEDEGDDEQSDRDARDRLAGGAAGDQLGQPGLEQRQLNAEHDRRPERAQGRAGQDAEPAFEQAAGRVEQQEGDKKRAEREHQPGDEPHRRQRADRSGQDRGCARRPGPGSRSPGPGGRRRWAKAAGRAPPPESSRPAQDRRRCRAWPRVHGAVDIIEPRDEPAAGAGKARGRDLGGDLGGAVEGDVVDQGPVGGPASRQRQHDADLDQGQHPVANAEGVAEQQAVAEQGDEQGQEAEQDQRQRRARRGERAITLGADRLRLAVDEIEHAAQEAVVGRVAWQTAITPPRAGGGSSPPGCRRAPRGSRRAGGRCARAPIIW